MKIKLSVFEVFHPDKIESHNKYQQNDSPIPGYRSKKQTIEKNHSHNTMSEEIFPIHQVYF
jgi:hypothetical protein